MEVQRPFLESSTRSMESQTPLTSGLLARIKEREGVIAFACKDSNGKRKLTQLGLQSGIFQGSPRDGEGVSVLALHIGLFIQMRFVLVSLLIFVHSRGG